MTCQSCFLVCSFGLDLNVRRCLCCACIMLTSHAACSPYTSCPNKRGAWFCHLTLAMIKYFDDFLHIDKLTKAKPNMICNVIIRHILLQKNRTSNLTRDVEYCICLHLYNDGSSIRYSTVNLTCDLLTPKFNAFISVP